MAPGGRERAARSASAPARRDGAERDRQVGNPVRSGDIFQEYADANRHGVHSGGLQRLQRAGSADLKRRKNDLRHESRFLRLADKVKEVRGPAFAGLGTSFPSQRTFNFSQSWGTPAKQRLKDGKIKAVAPAQPREERSTPPMSIPGGQIQALRTLQQMMGGGKDEKAAKKDGKANQEEQPTRVRSSLANLLSSGLAKAKKQDHDDSESASSEEDVTLGDLSVAIPKEDNTQGLLLEFASFVLDLGDGSLRAAYSLIDTEHIGRLTLVDWVVGLDNVGYQGGSGNAESVFRSLDMDSHGWLTLRDFQNLQPYLGIVLAAASRKKFNIEQAQRKSEAMPVWERSSTMQRGHELKKERGRRQSHWPGQEAKRATGQAAKTESQVDQTNLPEAYQTMSAQFAVTGLKKHERETLPCKVNRIMVFVNGLPNNTGVYLRFPRPITDMQDLYNVLDRVCRPLVGRICAVHDQNLRQLQWVSELREGAWYLVKGEENIAPPVMFLQHKGARGAPLLSPLQGQQQRSSTAPTFNTFDQSLHNEFDVTTIRPDTSPAATDSANSFSLLEGSFGKKCTWRLASSKSIDA